MASHYDDDLERAFTAYDKIVLAKERLAEGEIDDVVIKSIEFTLSYMRRYLRNFDEMVGDDIDRFVETVLDSTEPTNIE